MSLKTKITLVTSQKIGITIIFISEIQFQAKLNAIFRKQYKNNWNQQYE